MQKPQWLLEKRRAAEGAPANPPYCKLNLIQIQKWSFGMWETSPPAAPLLEKERFDKTLVPLL